MSARLGVNIDHVATVRQARRVRYPDPVAAALLAELGGADQITVHLRGDRRHIQDRDIRVLRQTVTTLLNVEMASTDEMSAIAIDLRPDTVTLVPERPGEVTTEGGLDLTTGTVRLDVERTMIRLLGAGIRPSLFIDPDPPQVMASRELAARVVELNTAAWSQACDEGARERELRRIIDAAQSARALGLEVAAGHGLTMQNVGPIVALGLVEEFNIGHAIVARAILVGMERAVREMKALL